MALDDVKYRTALNPEEIYSASSSVVAKGHAWTFPPDVDGNYPSDLGHGFVDLHPNDQFFSAVEVYSDQTMVVTGTAASTAAKSVGAAVGNSNSSYAYFAHSLIQNRTLSDRFGASVTSGFIEYLSYFRDAGDLTDIEQDPILGLGNVGVVAIKKIKFGEGIRPLTVTISTSAGTIADPSRRFTDTASGDGTWGILTDRNGASAGVVFYDLGVVLIHGPSLTAAQAISAVTAVTCQSTYKIWQLNAFCTAGADDLRQPSNPTAFYNRTVTGDPSFNQSLTAFGTYGYVPGDTSTTRDSSKGTYLLSNLGSTWGPYITTVGLYNESNDLVAIAKLSQPIKKPQTYPITIRVSLDFD